uniref:RNA helicase n=1 Tax=Nyssomyia neivai TaxID=330878 RepID=A0A1L8DJ02_9DIPT
MGDEWDDTMDTGMEFGKTQTNNASSQSYDSGYGINVGSGGYGSGGGGSGGRQPREPRAGDWTCSDCNQSNFASRSECFKCHKEKSDSDTVATNGSGGGYGGSGGGSGGRQPRAGDWTCSDCNQSNFASRDECFKCHKEKSDADTVATGDMSNGTGNKRQFSADDWKCSGCGKTNFASRRECFSCKEPKSGGAGGGGDEKPRAGSRPGDWTCPACDKANFASRTACFGCQEEKPAHLVSVTDEKPKEFYIPPELPTDENEIFSSKINQGVNFGEFQKIPVKVSGENLPTPINDFPSSGLREFLLTNVEKSGYTVPTPIQKHSIPVIMSGRDLMGCAQTGSGKTAAFLLPIINALLNDNRDLTIGQPHVLIITPTRELCIQITEQAHKFAHKSYIKVNKIYGGTATRYQGDALKGGTHILVATPGRLLDFYNRSYINFKDIRFIVLDEADRMLDMGFIDDIEKMMKDMPQERQTLMFSATFPEDIQHLAGKYLTNYVFVAVGIIGSACTDVEQSIMEVAGRKKRDTLMDILNKNFDKNVKGVLIFLETKKGADFLASYLSETQFPTTSIHSDRMQKEREQALGDFKSGRMGIMIATSVAARGLDIPNVQHVINFDLPKSIDEYVHRIGRTGRLGNRGKATSFFDPEKDSEIGAKLVTILGQANQPIPDFLEQYGGGMSGERGTFGGRDIRKDDNPRRGNVAPQEEEEEW